MNSITVTAPAKVNLLLKVLARQPDGYHKLYTLFERISLADKITIRKHPTGIKVTTDKSITVNPKDNLVYKAAKLIMLSKGYEGGVCINIKKNIPIAAGLGGGSSDAASVLLGINKLFGFGLSEAELVKLGRKLGADVPFFLLNTPFALGTGRGDIIKRVSCGIKHALLIINPGFELSTKLIYDKFDAVNIRAGHGANRLTNSSADDKIHPAFLSSCKFESVEQMLHNDLQDIAIAEKRVLGMIIKRLASSLGKKAIVSGSGPSIFCLYKNRKEAIAAKSRLSDIMPERERRGWQVFVAVTA